MFYGKKGDTFAYAMNHMLAVNHMQEIPYVNAISGRSFGLYCRGGVNQWFRTSVSCEEAVISLNQGVYEGHDQMKVRNARYMDADALCRIAKKGCVVGPVSTIAAIPHLKYELYHGIEQYVVCYLADPAYICVNIPAGIPLYYQKIAEWLELIQREEAYVIWNSSINIHENKYDWKGILKKGLDLHKKTAQKTAGYTIAYSGKSSEHAGLHMALDYYVLCMAEICEMIEQYCGDRIDQGYLHRWAHRIHDIKYTQDVGQIRKLDKEFWEYLYELVRYG